MGRAKRIHDVDIAQFCHFSGKRLIIRFFARVKAHVFTQHHLARLQINTREPFFDQPNGLPEKIFEMPRNRG